MTMRAHTHPECFSAGDPLAFRLLNVHKSKGECEMTWCTFKDLSPTAQEREQAQARAVLLEVRRAGGYQAVMDAHYHGARS